jgi:hypothetical protein
MQGTNDLSTRAPVLVPEALPSHLPKIYIYAKKGPTDPQLVVGDSMTQTYHADSFDLRQPWATHATVLANTVNAKGNQIMMQRVKPKDAPKPASMRLALDVLLTQVPVYARNADGSIKLDTTTGKPVDTGTKVAGAKAKWVVEAIPVDEDGVDQFGLGTQGDGDQTDDATQTQSVRYPILDADVSSFGADGNNQGLRFYAPTVNSTTPVDTRILTDELVYPLRAAFVSRTAANATPKLVTSQQGAQYLDVCLKPGVIDKNTDAQLYIGDTLIDAYQSLNNEDGTPNTYGPFGRLKVYDANVALLVKQLYELELPAINEFSDFSGVAGEEWLFNLLSGVSSFGVPYTAYQLDGTATNAVRLTESTTIYAQGGGDGTMSEALFADLVTDQIADYADPNSYLQNTAQYPESVFYDTGFPMASKLKLAQFIAVRKNCAVVLSTHDVLGPELTQAQESSAAIALKAALQMYPESDVFGTPCMRGLVLAGSGRLIGSQYTKPLPLTIELASKSAAYMGADNGRWKSQYNFDQAPGSVIDLFTKMNVTYRGATARNTDWDNGLCWVESFERNSYYFPALKTVYPDDTSVLNSWFTMMAICQLENIGEKARRSFSGTSSLTDAQLIQGVEGYIGDAVANKFGGRFTIVPVCTITGYDEQRGYSWTMVIKIYAPNMKTVGTLSIESYRIEDLQQAA